MITKDLGSLASFGAAPPPKREFGETDLAYQRRLAAWRARTGGGTPGLQDVGIPPPVAMFPATGPQLGDYASPGHVDLPQPSYGSTGPITAPIAGPGGGSLDPGYGRIVPGPPPPLYPVPAASPGRYSSPSDSIAPGLRAPFDGPPQDADRAGILAATRFDTAWGVPPDMPGLRWDPSRYIYAPTLDQAGTPYRIQASSFKFRQAYEDPSLGQGNWGVRWVSVQTTRPDPSRPYRILGPGEASAADVAVQQYLAGQPSGPGQASAGTGASKAVIVSGFLTGTGPAPGLPPGVSMVARKFRMADYAWLTQKDLPLECPYPYGAMPVPQADYASGRWLEPDYVPSIPLPPPYDQIPWQCGIPAGPAKKKGGGGPPDGTPGTVNTPSLSKIAPGAGGGEGTGSVSLSVGIPPPIGNIFASANPGDPAPVPVAPAPVPPKPCKVKIVVLGINPSECKDLATLAKTVAEVRSALARKAFYERDGCKAEVTCASSLESLACELYNMSAEDRAKQQYLNVELYGHGTSQNALSGFEEHFTGADDTTPAVPYGSAGAGGGIMKGDPWRKDAFSALGSLLGSIMTTGENANGHILLAWCHSCQPQGSARPAGLIAGKSGHTVFGPENSIEHVGEDGAWTGPAPGGSPFDESFPADPEKEVGGTKINPKNGWMMQKPLIGDKPNDGESDPEPILDRDKVPGARALPYSPWELGAGKSDPHLKADTALPASGANRSGAATQPLTERQAAAISALCALLAKH